MVRSDWVSVGIPKGLIEKLDQFLKTDESKRIGVTNRQQIISLLLRKFIEKGIGIFDESKKGVDPIIKQLEEKFEEMQDRLEKHEQLFMVYRLDRYRGTGSSQDTVALHGENAEKLIMKVDPHNSPHKITIYDTYKQQKRMKDNMIEGLITVKIRKEKAYCSYDKENDSCDHIKCAFDDPGFVELAIIKNVKNPILDKIISKNK